MKVLWICNLIPSFIARQETLPVTCMGSWVENLAKVVNADDISLTICCYSGAVAAVRKGNADAINYYIIPETGEEKLIGMLKDAISEVEPYIMHIWGTEYKNALCAVKAFGKPKRTVVHIQGVCSAIAQHYCNSIPHAIQSRSTLKDILRKTNVRQSQQKLVKAGQWEKEIIRNVSHVIGRTEFDRACTEIINPDIQYHFCGEALRQDFYECEKWDVNKCERHTVFISQAGYPVKGLHIALQGFALLKETFPDFKVYIAGEKIERPGSLKQKLRQTYYSKYILKLIDKLGLQEVITFVGSLDGSQIVERLQKANAYLLCSVIENSPNSLQEAMCVGTPVVASDVGGVKSFVEHNRTGFLYQHDAYYMMAYHLKKTFEEDEVSTRISDSEQTASTGFSDTNALKRRIEEIYCDICSME